MDVPITFSREDFTRCLKDNRKWSMVDISNMELFAMKNKDSTVTNVLKVKFKDDAQSTTVKRILTTSISFVIDNGLPTADKTTATSSKHRQQQRDNIFVNKADNIFVDNALNHRVPYPAT
ncbi:hypothetical protein JOM56_012824 [Amanita muscaria]